MTACEVGTVERALVIASPWIDRILEGRKTWEMRSTDTRIRGRIALVRKGTKQIVGVARLVETHGPLGPADLYAATDRHAIAGEALPRAIESGWTYAWVLADVRQLEPPVSYCHPRGAVVWIRLNAEDRAALSRRLDWPATGFPP